MNERLWTEIKRLHKEISTGEKQLDGIVIERIKRLMRLDSNHKRKKGLPIHNPEALRWWRRKTQALEGGPSLLNTWPIKDPSLAAWRRKRLLRQQLRQKNTASMPVAEKQQVTNSEPPPPRESIDEQIKVLQKRLQTESLLLHEEVIPAIRRIMRLDSSLSPDYVTGLRPISVLDWWRSRTGQKKSVSSFVPQIKTALPKPKNDIPKPYIPALDEPSQEEDIEFFLVWTNRLRDLCGQFESKTISPAEFASKKKSLLQEFVKDCEGERESKRTIIVKQWRLENLIDESDL